MNTRTVTLAIVSLISAGFACVTPASAEGNARFNFAPNTWRADGVHSRTHRATDPVHSVRSGAVPVGKSFLGLDPQLLQKPQPIKQVAPAVMPQMQVAATPSFTQATPQVAVPKTTFNQAFGQPQTFKPPVIAQAPVANPPVAQMATPQALPPAKAQATKPQAVRKPTRSTQDVNGTIASRPRKTRPAGDGMLANAGKGIDSYGKNFGYVPGPFLPATQSGGTYTQTDVHGTLLSH